MSVRVRYAPSPTGTPHVGNLRTAIYDWLLARKCDGLFLARLEDTDRDPSRYKPESTAEIEESLRFLGILPDEWWVTGGPRAPYVQSERLETYTAAADQIIASGHAYRCYCTEERLREMRERQQAQGLPTGYDRRCRYLSEDDRRRSESEGLGFVVRQAIPLEGETVVHDAVYGDISFENRRLDDPVLLKTNGWPTYHLAALVDDHAWGITHVFRGEEWISSAPKHVQLYRAFGWDEPIWVHLPLLIGADRKKLGKRHGSTAFPEFIRAGYLPEALFNFLVLLGWSAGDENREIFTVSEIIERFGLEGISKHPAVFDYEKLKWMNGEYIRAMPAEQLAQRCLPFLQQAGLIASSPSDEELAYTSKVVPLITDRMKLLSEAGELAELFYRQPQEPEEKGRRKWLSDARATEILSGAAAEITALERLTEESAETVTNAIAAALEVERGPVIHTLRIAVTGKTVGPGLFELMAVLGRDRVLARLERAMTWVIPA